MTLSPAQAVVQAAKELQEAMDSGDALVLKKAIDNAKLHKVSPEAGNSKRNSDRTDADSDQYG